MELSCRLWLAELGRPQTVWVYDTENNILDVMESVVGIAYRLKRKLDETEIALYDSPHSHYSEPLEICPIVNGQAQVTRLHALAFKGLHHTCPLGVASGSMLRQLADKDIKLKKQK